MTPSVDIPVVRGGECGYITLDAESDDPDVIWSHVVLGSSGYVAVGTERMAIRTHLLMPRGRYPEPPKWEGMVINPERWEGIKVVATLDGLAMYARDPDDGEYYEYPDKEIPWADVIAAMRKIGVRV